MNNDIWHFPRLQLAQQVLTMFESGLSNALVFFAPRRMGKTEFLLKDMKPLAEKKHWHVLYFSFLDTASNASDAFTSALLEFALKIGATKGEGFQRRIKRISAGAGGLNAGIEFRNPDHTKMTLKKIIDEITKHHHKILFLLDEVQVLSQVEKNKDFVAALRTMLDINKDKLKVIFTGSSREGLRGMFSKSDAPFFHFGQNLPFPEFDQDFIHHLTQVFNKVTQRNIDDKKLWTIFIEMGKVPQLIRSLIERIALHPNLSLQQAQQLLLKDITEDREYAATWENISALEQFIVKTITLGEKELFSENRRTQLATQMGIDSLSVSTLQSAVRTLQRKHIIVNANERGNYYIDDPNFQSWIQRTIIDNKT